MTKQYSFQVDQRVTHNEVSDCTGTILHQMSFDEETGLPLNEVNVNIPWYSIMWDSGEEGFEHQDSLTPEE